MQSNNGRRVGQTFGLILIGLGILFMLGTVFNINMSGLFRLGWPFFIIVPGIGLATAGVMGGKSTSPLTIFGSVVTTVGLILLYQSTFNHWQSWAYAWTLLPVGAGAGMYIHGTINDEPDLARNGLRVAMTGLVLFAIFWVFFELLIGISGFHNASLGKIFGPLLLIGLGGYVLLRQPRTKQKR
ncbi:MAG: hypothetical protein ABI947_07160 [Chloroflexota bacterium]